MEKNYIYFFGKIREFNFINFPKILVRKNIRAYVLRKFKQLDQGEQFFLKIYVK